MAHEFAALLIDFENIFYFLKNKVLPDGREMTVVIVDMIRSLNAHLLKEFGESVISMDAYADFDRINESAQSELYLLGVEPHYVLGTDTKNAADIKLCIDTLDILYNRPEVRSFIFVAGDRDYIPVLKYLRLRGKVVRVVGFPESTSGDLLRIVGRENFIPASEFIPAMRMKAAAAAVAGTKTAPAPLQPPQKPPAAPQAAWQVPPPPAWRSSDEELAPDLERYEPCAVQVAFEHFRGRGEIYLTPYLHKLRSEMPEFTESERKQIISQLEQKGAYRLEKRKGEPYDYSVIIVNWNHTLIRDLNPGS